LLAAISKKARWAAWADCVRGAGEIGGVSGGRIGVSGIADHG
jgi:hypothetical protein